MEGNTKEKEVSQCSYEELEQLAKVYGVSDDNTLSIVQLDALVAMKIIKHCRENLPELVTGQLLGLDVGTTLEVTNCFPFPKRSDDANSPTSANINAPNTINSELEEQALNDYQIQMLRAMRDVNADNNTVGWYTSTLASFWPESLISDQFKYQTTIAKCVVVVYDPLKSAQGELSFKAYRLTPAFMELHKTGQFTQARLARAKLSYDNIFEEIPLTLRNPALAEAFLFEVEGDRTCIDSGSTFDRFDLGAHSFLETNLEFLIETADRLAEKQGDFRFYQHNYHRQQAAINKRKQAGETLEDIMATLKPLQEPEQKNTLFMLHQMNTYCAQISRFSAQACDKLYLLEGMHNGSQPIPSSSTTSASS